MNSSLVKLLALVLYHSNAKTYAPTYFLRQLHQCVPPVSLILTISLFKAGSLLTFLKSCSTNIQCACGKDIVSKVQQCAQCDVLVVGPDAAESLYQGQSPSGF